MLLKKRGINYSLITPMFQYEFEHDVLNAYESTIEDHPKTLLPHIYVDLMLKNYLEPEYPVASMLNMKFKDPNYYSNETRFLSTEEKNVFLHDKVQLFSDYSVQENNILDDLLYADIQAVLNAHLYSYIDIGYLNAFGSFVKKDTPKNLPGVEVW